MNRLLVLILCLSFSISANAGFFKDLLVGVVANEITEDDPGSVSVSPAEEKRINRYLWNMVSQKNYEPGYEFYVDILERSREIAYVNTAAMAYFDNGKKELAIEIYETRILPTARVFDRDYYEKAYRNLIGEKEDYVIPYNEIYQKIKEKNKPPVVVEPMVTPDQVLWGIAILLGLNVLVGLGVFIRLGALRKASV